MQFNLRLRVAEQIQQSDDAWLNISGFSPSALLNQLKTWYGSIQQHIIILSFQFISIL